jgi:methionine synthase I (cobalamin-dependent)
MSHDEAEEYDRGNPAELAGDCVKLNEIIPVLRVVGGCCRTDHEHVTHIAAAVA